MLYKKLGMPEEGEIVLCTVTKIHYNSVFASLNEYPGKQGMIHISEISPGRIRNIRDFVEEGKIIICKILSIDREKGHIDLSLRRVNDSQKRIKNNIIKQEQLAEKIIEFASQELKVEFLKLYEQIAPLILKNYEYIYPCFEAVSRGEMDLEEQNIPKNIADVLKGVIEQRIKPPIVEIKANMKLSSYEKYGIEDIKKSLIKAKDVGGEKTTIRYLGSGTYQAAITTETYKEAEDILKNVINAAKTTIESSKGTFEYTRQDSK